MIERRHFERIAIVNRGEPAMRLERAVRDWNGERGEQVRTIALYTEPDRDSLYVREADLSCYLGPATFLDERDLDEKGRPRSKSRYLDYGALRAALVETRADAAWVGWGFVAEHAAFAELCAELGVVFIGPSPEAMRRLGDKIGSKRLAEQAGVPVAPWSGGPVATLEEARRAAAVIGYPLLVKATAGGGGRGIRFVSDESELAQALESAASEARKAFGDATTFLEARVPAARHVEVQVLADAHGRVWPVGVRDCTVQRSNQKVVEEAPSPVLRPVQSEALCEAAVRIARAAGYENAGTVEFLFDPSSGHYYFMEMNTRLQVEHPVTELTTGVDLVRLQLAVARGEPLADEPPPTRGHAIEVRLCAEDPDRGFAPSPGRVARFRPPLGAGVRTDAGLCEGEQIPVEFDSMIAKLIAYGDTREQARARLLRALAETLVVVEGGTTNRTFLMRLLGHPEFVESRIDTKWLDRTMQAEGLAPGRAAHVALLATAIVLHERQLHDEALNFFGSAARGRPAMPAHQRRPIELRYGGATYEFRVATLGPGEFRVEVDGGRLELRLDHDGPHEARLSYVDTGGEQRYRLVIVPSGLDWLVDVDGCTYRVSGDPGGLVRAPAPALVLALHVAEGDRVRRGERLLSLEAMKMEMPITAPFAGRVRRVLTAQSMQVGAGDALLVLEPENDAGDAPRAAERLAIPRSPAATAESGSGLGASSRQLRGLMLGFHVGPEVVDNLVGAWRASGASPEGGAPSAPSADDARALVDALGLYVDSEAPFSRTYSDAGELRLSHEQSLHLYLREFRAEGSGLPPSFQASLRAALAHYGVSSLSDSPRLRDAIVWLYRSHQNRSQKGRVLLALLQHCLDDAAWHQALGTQPVRELLDRLISLTQETDPLLCEWAQQARYVLFEGRAFEARRREALGRVGAAIASLERDPDSPERLALMTELASIPFAFTDQLVPLLASATEQARLIMLEVIARRLYRHHALDDLFTLQVGDRPHLMARLDSGASSVLLGSCRVDEVGASIARLPEVAAQLKGSRLRVNLLVDVPEPLDDEAEVAWLAGELASVVPPPALHRMCFVLSHPKGVQYVTFAPRDGAWREDELVRGLHPTVGERLELWRMSGFRVERLATSSPDLYLFLARAHENPRDERFFVVAEVREMHPERDDEGRLVAVPEVEHAILQAYSAIRAQQSRRDLRRRLHWNRVTVFLRPTLLARREDFLSMARRLEGPATTLGLEKVAIRMFWHEDGSQVPRDTVVAFSNRTGQRLEMTITEPHQEPLRVLDDYSLKVVRARQRRTTYAYEIVKMLARGEASGDFPAGEFVEHDLGEGKAAGELVPVPDRPYGGNSANVVVGVVRSFTAKHPEGMARVLVVGDGTRDMGALAEPECRRIIAALDLAERMRVPLEWFPVSSGARIAMDSGTENLDWTAAVLRRIIEFTQSGGEINVVVDGTNVGAQSYWNAEATMLMHTRGCLVMTPRGNMLLTGKRALDYSGGVSAEDNLGIGGFERIMGPNGQAQYHAEDLHEACRILLRHYEHTYVAPGETGPRSRPTADPADRNVCLAPYAGVEGFETLGEIWSDERNGGRHKPFDIRVLLRAVMDVDAAPLERWPALTDGEGAVVWDAHLGGYPVCLIGVESKPLPRVGWAPSDGPDSWSGGTLFPLGSKKVARGINAASGNRPVVVLANLSGFDGSPESMRRLQLEYGAEIGRAVVNFKGPLVFCVVARYHGGAYVVFSKRLNPGLRALALRGSFASVIGGAAAAAVVFPQEARAMALEDPRVVALGKRLETAGLSNVRAREEYQDLFARVLAEKTREIAQRFDGIHDVERARKVGSLDGIVEPSGLRPALIEAIAAGLGERAAAQPAEGGARARRRSRARVGV